ncbi:MAG: hypothetical protein R2856_17455 [Caldilineaceae bacterium]
MSCWPSRAWPTTEDAVCAVVEHTEQHGGFNEYNSPTYTVVVLHECENILHLVEDAQARADAETLRVFAWETIAEHFHPATQQWSGPNSRAYTDRVPASLCGYLTAQTGVEIRPHPDAPDRGSELPLPYHLPCPPHLTERFRTLPQPEMTIERRFITGGRGKHGARRHLAGRGRHPGQCQPRLFLDAASPCPRLLAHRRRPRRGAASAFPQRRTGLSSAYVRNVQHGRRILSAVNLLTDRGDFHISLDRPADGRFTGSDLRLRYELTGHGVTARQVRDGVYELAAGNHRAVIHTAPGQFGEHAVTWRLGQDEGRVFLDAVCYTGPEMTFDPAEIVPVRLAAGTELLPHNAPITEHPVNIDLSTEEKAVARWGEDAIEVPTRAHKYQA